MAFEFRKVWVILAVAVLHAQHILKQNIFWHIANQPAGEVRMSFHHRDMDARDQLFAIYPGYPQHHVSIAIRRVDARGQRVGARVVHILNI